MTRASHIGRVAYAAESAWAESSTTFGTAIPHEGDVNELIGGLVQPTQYTGVTYQYRNDASPNPILMPQGGQFTIRLHLTGHGSTTSGAVSLTDLETLLGRFFGAAAVSASSGDTFTGGTAGTPTTTSASGFNPGAIGWAGVLGDGRGEGQAFVVSSHGSNNLALRTNLPGAPNNGDVCYSGTTISTEESVSAADVVSTRWLFQSGDLQRSAHGCFPMSAAFTNLTNGLDPFVELTYGVSRWADRAATFPDTQATEFQATTNTAGSFFIQAHGTATRATKSIRDFVLNYQVGISPLPGPGGIGEYQTIVGASRTQDVITGSYTVDSESATTSPAEAAAWQTTRHLLYNLNGHATGQRLAIYLSNICRDQNVPNQVTVDGLNRVTVNFRGLTNRSVTTSELTLSAFRLGIG